MKAYFAAIALAGFWLAGCSAARPDGADDTAGQPDLSIPAFEESTDSVTPNVVSRHGQPPLDENGLSNVFSDHPLLDPAVSKPEGKVVAASKGSQNFVDKGVRIQTEPLEPSISVDRAVGNESTEDPDDPSKGESAPLAKSLTAPAEDRAGSHDEIDSNPAEAKNQSDEDFSPAKLDDLPKAANPSENLPVGKNHAPSFEEDSARPVSPSAPPRSGTQALSGTKPGPASTPKSELPLTDFLPVDGASGEPAPALAPEQEQTDQVDRTDPSSRPEGFTPADEETVSDPNSGNDSPINKFPGQEASRPRTGFGNGSVREDASSQNENEANIGFSSTPSLSSWLRSKPRGRVGFSDDTKIVEPQKRLDPERKVAFGEGEWKYRSTASWLDRRDAESKTSGNDRERSYEALGEWLERVEATRGRGESSQRDRDYIAAEAWLSHRGAHKSSDGRSGYSRNYSALAKWLTKDTSDLPAGNQKLRIRMPRDYSKIELWLRGNREP